jgi:LuxR family transcriptional regulator, maltose regulon positive regulatory protein
LPETLLSTKLYIPSLHTQVVLRQSILDLMNDGLSIGKRLTLVCAPAGYGKTTLVCEWLQKIPQPCWISLDKSDNDTRLFFSYLIAALQTIRPDVGGQAQAILDAPQPPPLQAVLSSLLNDLAQIHSQTVIVLDDYQSIHTSRIHEGIAFLLDHLPPEVHFVITTRSDPALPLHRYRSRGQLVEIRADDLRFTTDEVYAFMRDIAGVSLSASEIATLESRTEGWAAGLQMAAISLRKKANITEFIHSFAGSNRYILDYLMEEVLKNQTPDVQQFLMETAILDRLCLPLCDALFQPGEVPSQQILQYLEHENLFVLPLDNEGYWYRYHHLFQDLLLMRLKQTTPERIQTLHRSAANWYETNGWISEAVQHYIQGDDFERAADVVEQHTLQLFAQGKLDQLMSWIQKLPSDLSARRPWLSIHQAWVMAFAGKNSEAELLIQNVIDVSAAKDALPEERKKLWTEIHGIRALISITSGDMQKALASADLMDAEIHTDHLFARSVILWSHGFAWRMQGKIDKSIAAFREVLQIGKQINNLWTLSTSYADLGMVLRLSGKLQEAEPTYREGLKVMKQSDAGGLGFVGRLESFLANVLYEKNELDESIQLVNASIAHNEMWNNPNHVAHAYWTKSRILFGMNDSSVEEALGKAETAAAHPAVVPTLRTGVDALRVRFWLKKGRLNDAAQWMESNPLNRDASQQNMEAFEMLALTHVRILLAQENISAASNLLEELETPARDERRNNTLIEILTLKSLASTSRASALTSLESALSLGITQGYRRTFLDEGPKLKPLLESLRGRTKLVEPLIGGDEAKQKADGPLTARELDIVRSMADGLSNKEIGQKLFISAGTVKAHSAAIYRKLEVANRTGAIARAKDLGLV